MRTRRWLAHSCLGIWLFIAGAWLALYRVHTLFGNIFGKHQGLASAGAFELKLGHFISPIYHYMGIFRLIMIFLGLTTLALYGRMLRKDSTEEING